MGVVAVDVFCSLLADVVADDVFGSLLAECDVVADDVVSVDASVDE